MQATMWLSPQSTLSAGCRNLRRTVLGVKIYVGHNLTIYGQAVTYICHSRMYKHARAQEGEPDIPCTPSSPVAITLGSPDRLASEYVCAPWRPVSCRRARCSVSPAKSQKSQQNPMISSASRSTSESMDEVWLRAETPPAAYVCTVITQSV